MSSIHSHVTHWHCSASQPLTPMMGTPVISIWVPWGSLILSQLLKNQIFKPLAQGRTMKTPQGLHITVTPNYTWSSTKCFHGRNHLPRVSHRVIGLHGIEILASIVPSHCPDACAHWTCTNAATADAQGCYINPLVCGGVIPLHRVQRGRVIKAANCIQIVTLHSHPNT